MNRQPKTIITTPRLILREWSEADLEPFAAMNADPRVMEHFPGVNTFEESQKEYQRVLVGFQKHNYSWWVASQKGEDNFMGFIGLRHIDFKAAFTPAVEVAWRLAYPYWGHGYATEGALASLHYGFETLNLPSIISITAQVNLRSQAVMKRIGLHHIPAFDFDHPKLPKEHRLSRHVFYKITREQWKQGQV